MGTIVPIVKCLLSHFTENAREDKSPHMSRNFRDAYIAALERSEVSMRRLSEETGVSYDQLKKLRAREDASTNVDDAIKIAAFFGQHLHEFLEDPASQGTVEVLSLYAQLPDELRAQYEAYGRGLLHGSDRPKKSESAGNKE